MSITVEPVCSRFFFVMNAGAGSDDARTCREIIERVFAEVAKQADVHAEIMVVDASAGLDRVAARAVEAAESVGGAVVAAGGDGTIRSVAQAALGRDCLFGVLPLGTFNLFARTHDIPIDVEAATRHLLVSRPVPVQVGVVNERVFLVNASLGLYPQLLEDREAFKRQYGRRRVVAMLAALLTILRGGASLKLIIEHEGQSREVRTPTLFVGNNALQLERIGMPEARAPAFGLLAGIVVRPGSTARMLLLALRGALGNLGQADDVTGFAFREMTVRPRRGAGSRVKVATDGETCVLSAPLRFAVSPRHLRLIKDASPAAGERP